MLRPPPRSTPLYSSAASDVYKRHAAPSRNALSSALRCSCPSVPKARLGQHIRFAGLAPPAPVARCRILELSLIHISEPTTSQDLVCRLLLEKKTRHKTHHTTTYC